MTTELLANLKEQTKDVTSWLAAAFGLFFSLSLFLSSQKSAGQIVLDNFVFPERRKKERRLLLASVAASDGGKGIDGVGN